MTRVSADGTVPTEPGSDLALDARGLAAAEVISIADGDRDTLVYVARGFGSLQLDGSWHELTSDVAALVLAGEQATITAGDDGLELVHATVGPYVDRHAAMGDREVVVAVAQTQASSATGKRSFQLLFGPHNGSIRATLFAGFIPSGWAPWHYHLYDEIVWVPRGPGRLHLESGVEELGPGAAFRLHAREVHVVENAGDGELAVVGLFTPAGSPSAAYIPAGGPEPVA